MGFMEELERMKQELEAYQTGGTAGLESFRKQGKNNEVVDSLKGVEEAVKKLHPKEQTELDKELDDFLNDGVNPRVKAAKEKFMKMNTYEQDAIRKNNPELYEAMFPTPKVEYTKPANYDDYKKLVMAGDGKDVAKLPYQVRLYAAMQDPEFNTFIEVADNSAVAALESQHVKNLKAARQAAEGENK